MLSVNTNFVKPSKPHGKIFQTVSQDEPVDIYSKINEYVFMSLDVCTAPQEPFKAMTSAEMVLPVTLCSKWIQQLPYVENGINRYHMFYESTRTFKLYTIIHTFQNCITPSCNYYHHLLHLKETAFVGKPCGWSTI